jgi:formylglycine-generating enzyme required for sulfatase activity
MFAKDMQRAEACTPHATRPLGSIVEKPARWRAVALRFEPARTRLQRGRLQHREAIVVGPFQRASDARAGFGDGDRGIRFASRREMNLGSYSRRADSKHSLGPLLFGVAILLGACGSNRDGSSNDDAKGGSGTSSTAGASSDTTAGTAADPVCTSTAEPGDMVQVPAGDFGMGCNAELDDGCSNDEKPLHTAAISAFEIDRTEVTQAQYAACLSAGKCTAPSCDWNCDNQDFPAGCVTWDQADAYCGWAGKRLPTEAEWEKAARGPEGSTYPWGNDEPDCSLANMSGCSPGALAVGSLAAGASPYGALDMAGNVVELVADWYDEAYYASSPPADPAGPKSGTRHVGRGGGFKSDAEYLRTSKRDWYDATDAAASLGFRCAR